MLVAVIFMQIFAIFAIMMVIVCETWQIKKEEVIEEYTILRRNKIIGILYVIKRTYVSGKIKIIEKRIYT